MAETSDQYDAAVQHLLGLMVMLAEKPGAIDLAELPDWLLMAGNERERQGDFGAARLLDRWSDQLRDMVKGE